MTSTFENFMDSDQCGRFVGKYNQLFKILETALAYKNTSGDWDEDFCQRKSSGVIGYVWVELKNAPPEQVDKYRNQNPIRRHTTQECYTNVVGSVMVIAIN